jgi:tRNA threonylcarbamoyladenosine modification (KEOPS) complex Cgi121 subunit
VRGTEMLFNLEKYGVYAEISGFAGVSFEQAEQFLKKYRNEPSSTVDIQFFNADLIASSQHLKFAALNALEAFKGKMNISKNLAMEIMLYASVQRQIQKAIRNIGLNKNSQNVAVVIVGKDMVQVQLTLAVISSFFGVKPDESVLELTAQKQTAIKEVFQITDSEIEAVTKGDTAQAIIDLIIEREALLSTQI